MKYYITAKGDWGDCIVGYDNEPTWNIDNAMFFDTYGEATEWTLSEQAKEWNDDFDICEVKND